MARATMTPNLKVVTPDTSERAALAEALANAEAASRNLQEAERASDNALEKLGTAFRRQEDLQRLHRDIKRNADAIAASREYGRLISALADGEEVETPEPPHDRLLETTQQLAAAERDIAKWREIRVITEKEISDRRAAMEAAQRDLEKAAATVAVSTVDVDAIIEATAANIARLRQLNAFAPDNERIRAALKEVDWRQHPAAMELRVLREALMRDADAVAAL